MHIDDQNCGNCRFARSVSDEKETYDCRRRPPEVYLAPNDKVERFAIWPTVYVDDWCGEWMAWPPEVQSDG